MVLFWHFDFVGVLPRFLGKLGRDGGFYMYLLCKLVENCVFDSVRK